MLFFGVGIKLTTMQRVVGFCLFSKAQVKCILARLIPRIFGGPQECHPVLDKGISRDALVPPPAILESLWFEASTLRAREVISFAFKFKHAAKSVDCGQTINRCSLNCDDVLPTITPDGKTFLMYELDSSAPKPMSRLLLGYEALAIQGFPVELLSTDSSLSNRQMHDLAGNAFPSTCLMACLLGIFAHVPPKTMIASPFVNAFGSDSRGPQLHQTTQHSFRPGPLGRGVWSGPHITC